MSSALFAFDPKEKLDPCALAYSRPDSEEQEHARFALRVAHLRANSSAEIVEQLAISLLNLPDAKPGSVAHAHLKDAYRRLHPQWMELSMLVAMRLVIGGDHRDDLQLNAPMVFRENPDSLLNRIETKERHMWRQRLEEALISEGRKRKIPIHLMGGLGQSNITVNVTRVLALDPEAVSHRAAIEHILFCARNWRASRKFPVLPRPLTEALLGYVDDKRVPKTSRDPKIEQHVRGLIRKYNLGRPMQQLPAK